MRVDCEEETWCWWPLDRKYKPHWRKYKATVLRRHKNGTVDVRYKHDGTVETDVEVRLLVAAVLHLTAISAGSAAW